MHKPLLNNNIDAQFQFASTEETPTKIFIDNVLIVYTRMLAIDNIRLALEEADEQLPEAINPIKKANTLHIICMKGGAEDRILFAVSLMTKLAQNGEMPPAELGARKVKGMDGCVSLFGPCVCWWGNNLCL